MSARKIYLAGKWVANKNQIQVLNPYTNSIVAKTYLASKEDLDRAILLGLESLVQLKKLPTYKKSNVLIDIAQKIKERKQRLAQLICSESGKPMKYALSEVDRAVQTFIVASEETKRLPKEYISLDWTVAGENKEGLVKYFPIGLVAGISPFNFPLNLVAHKVAPAIAAGCPIIIKPASTTPLTCLALAEIIHETDLPKQAFSVLPMDRQIGNQLITDKRISLLSFTGSPKVGWKMKFDAGNKKVVLELGGNAGVYVSETANLSNTVERCVMGGFSYSGQVCIHTQRIYVINSLFDEFVDMFINKTKLLNIGDPNNINTDFSVMINEENNNRVLKWIEESVKCGAKILYGGKLINGIIQPTIITNTNTSMKVNCEEVFGPVVIIEKVEDCNTAIQQLNNTSYGLQAGIFTDSMQDVNLAFDQLDVGGVIVNDVPTFRVDHMPYGGVKNSGFGREGVKYAIMDMLEPKILVKNTL